MRRRRTLRLLVLALCALAVPAAIATGWRPLLERLPGFAVERVEIRGAALVAPQEALEAMQLQEGESVWQRTERWEARLGVHPLIATAEVRRQLPNGLRVTLLEERPVALLSGDALVAVSEEGVMLPVPPGRLGTPLPVIRMAGPGDGVHRLAALAVERPRLAPRLLEIVEREEAVVLRLAGEPSVEVLLPAASGAQHLARLEAVLDDLALAGGASAGLVADLRFADQVVVRPASSR